MVHQRGREQRLRELEETIWRCEREEKLLRRIEYSVENTRVWTQPFENPSLESISTISCRIIMQRIYPSDIRYISQWHKGHKIGVFCWMSSVNVGGSVICGKDGNEERLCRHSTLYPCLTSDYMGHTFYKRDGEGNLCENSERIVFIPKVQLLYGGKDNIYGKAQDIFLDVIGCTMPISNETELFKKQLDKGMQIARHYEIDTLIIEQPECMHAFSIF